MTDKKKPIHIDCPRFGGARLPHACIAYDRYKSCRKNCASLKKYIEDNPNAVEESMEILKQRQALTLPSQYAGKGLPVAKNPEFVCKVCGFEAKSLRGLKSHQTRAHGMKRKTKRRKRKAKKAS